MDIYNPSHVKGAPVQHTHTYTMQTDRQTDRQTDIPFRKLADRQTDRQTDRHTFRKPGCMRYEYNINIYIYVCIKTPITCVRSTTVREHASHKVQLPTRTPDNNANRIAVNNMAACMAMHA